MWSMFFEKFNVCRALEKNDISKSIKKMEKDEVFAIRQNTKTPSNYIQNSITWIIRVIKMKKYTNI